MRRWVSLLIIFLLLTACGTSFANLCSKNIHSCCGTTNYSQCHLKSVDLTDNSKITYEPITENYFISSNADILENNDSGFSRIIVDITPQTDSSFLLAASNGIHAPPTA
ncbi:hypothetical protein HZC34_05960 [Candidatus Saganbacteria bacterium]|nr:hypothetical protein [Candidatus Saganbacteria bacterium]